MHLLEVVHAQEESHATRKLAAGDRGLTLAICAREQNPGNSPSRPNDDPSFRPAIVRQRWNVLNELELQDVDEETNGGVIVPHDERDELEVSHLITSLASNQLRS